MHRTTADLMQNFGAAAGYTQSDVNFKKQKEIYWYFFLLHSFQLGNYFVVSRIT
jgi:hypothetical protein